jgi:hypothetical protein
MHGRNDVDHLIDDAVANGESFYTLSYRPATPISGDPKEFRRIRVTLKDSSLTAISRQGYFPSLDNKVAAPLNAQGKLTDNAQFDLASASTGLMVFDGVPLTIERNIQEPAKVVLSFPASALGLVQNGGKLTGDVTLITLSFDRNGKPLSKDGRVVALHLAPLPAGQMEDRKVRITTTLNTQLPIARVRYVLRANSNGKIGAENLMLVDPATLHDHATGVRTQPAH